MAFLHQARRLCDAPYTLWALLALPGVYWLAGYWRETFFYGELVHLTGDFAVQLLIATLAVTPLSLLFRRAAWTRWLVERRRYLGVAAFGYSLLHTLIYLERQADLARIIDDAMAAAMWTGWLAFLIMGVLALTSNDASVGKLKRGWKRLHRAVYVAAGLSFAHWILSAFDPTTGYIHLAVLAGVFALRFGVTGWRKWRH